jgi:hypothetical protein
VTDWEAQLERWGQPPGVTERERMENAERMVKAAIQASPQLQARDIRVFVQGSYRNRVNVRSDSDVDVGVVCFDTYFPEYPDDNVRILMEKRAADATYTYANFKDDVEIALVAKFGRQSVARGPKAFDVKATSYRVDADVAAFCEHRRYTSASQYLSGVQMFPEDGRPTVIRNWPEQHYSNGVNKNDRTGRRYKKMVRILKSLACEMSDEGISSAQSAPSFLIECLVWNAPDDAFVESSYRRMTRAVLAHLFNETIVDESCVEWGEVSELKYLFRSSQPWTRLGAHQFISDCWDYLELT